MATQADVKTGSTPQFTPGPWEYLAADCESGAVVSPPADSGDGIGPWFTAIITCGDDDVATANARLVAAAPDLYEACRLFEAAANMSVFDDASDAALSKAHDATVAALAKARGQ